MYTIQATHNASKFEPEDFISNIPDNVTTNIMDRLQLRDAVKTSILSRKWRFKWSMLSQLVFDWKFFLYFLNTKHETDFGGVISRILLHVQGSITKFVLSLDEAHYSVNVEDISLWILFLSRKGIKDLTIDQWDSKLLKMPTHFFSCLDLQHLKLGRCCFDPPDSFRGFPNLLSLELLNVRLGKFVKFFTRCPVIEIFKLTNCPYDVLNLVIPNLLAQVKLVEIAKLANLKRLSLFLSYIDNTCSSSSIFELVGSLPKLQDLHLDFLNYKFTEGVAEKWFPNSFPCLKALKLSQIGLANNFMLSYAFQMIRSFPNLETIEITSSYSCAPWTPGNRFVEVLDYNTKLGLLQLRNVVFRDAIGSENEVILIKYLLACSPLLKRIVIHPDSCLVSDNKFIFASKLLKLHRASPIAEIDL